uniref:Uncharacterized protein n=1 Tax=Setaria viridis TaxID=4556 RepID=A0A4U6U6R6_SETVI|nr:hypothetical protein SEVIR_6G133554v2 [Setaria viridis]
MKLIVVGRIAGEATGAEAVGGTSIEAPTPADGAPAPADGAAAGGAVSGASDVGEVPEGVAIGEARWNVDGRRCRRERLEAKEDAGGRRRSVRQRRKM